MQGCELTVRVVPRASRNRVRPEPGGVFKVHLTAPPLEGKANQALVQFLADALDVRPRCVEILTGERGRLKRVRVSGLDAAEAARRLGSG